MVRGLPEAGVKVLFVTHMFDLAEELSSTEADNALVLRAERGLDGERSFKLSPGELLPTSYGEDSYRKIFGRASIWEWP